MPGFKINGAGQGPNADVEPARVHRFSFRFDTLGGLRDVVLYALSSQRPSVEIDQIKIHHKQTEAYLPGKHKWSAINVKFYELTQGLAGGTTSSQIFNYWAGGQGGPIDFRSNSIRNGFGKADVDINLEDGQGSPVHIYKLYGVWPTKVEPVELNYSSSDLSTVQVTFRYDSAYEAPGANNVGAFIA